MKSYNTNVNDLKIITLDKYDDIRGSFFEMFNFEKISDALDYEFNCYQVNQSISRKGVLRGMHFQEMRPQAKIVYVQKGEINDVVIDLRQDSSTFGESLSFHLSSSDAKLLFVPKGFAHGFNVKSDEASVIYFVDEKRYEDYERVLSWDDEKIISLWGQTDEIILSKKDSCGLKFEDINFKSVI